MKDTSYNMDDPTEIMMNKRSQTQKSAFCMIPFYMKFKNREINSMVFE